MTPSWPTHTLSLFYRGKDNRGQKEWSLIVQNLGRPHHGHKPADSRCSLLTESVSSWRTLSVVSSLPLRWNLMTQVSTLCISQLSTRPDRRCKLPLSPTNLFSILDMTKQNSIMWILFCFSWTSSRYQIKDKYFLFSFRKTIATIYQKKKSIYSHLSSGMTTW